MIKKKYIPTPLIEKKKRKKVKVVEKLETRRLSIYYVVWKFIVYFWRIRWRNITGKSDIRKTATQLRELFEELGGFWVKAGQLLALRNDFLAQEICEELSLLQFGALGFPMEIVRSTIEEELGFPLENIFDDFDEEPLAAASIAQIHLAVLRNQKKTVVVKVQRPGLVEAFGRDLTLVKALINLIVSLNIGAYLRLNEAVSELEKIFKEELDYRYEAFNARRMRKTLKEHKIYVPKIYSKYTRRRVLVMEFIDGVMMSDYLETLQKDPIKVQKWEDENKVDPEKLGEKLLISLFRQLLEDNLYHADLHPGNIILLRDTRFVIIDMGSVGSLDKEFITNYSNYIGSLSKGDFTTAIDYLLRFSVGLPRINLPEVRVEGSRALQTWATKSQIKELDFQEKSFASATQEIYSNVLSPYKVPTNWTFLKVTRSIFTLDGSLKYLLKDLEFFKIIQKYIRQSERRSADRGIQSFQPENLAASINRFSDAVAEYNSIVIPQLRHQSAPFEMTVDPFALALVVFLRATSFTLLIGELGLLYSLLYQHNFEIIKSVHNQLIEEIVNQLPYIPSLAWTSMMAITGLIALTSLICANILTRKEYKGIGS